MVSFVCRTCFYQLSLLIVLWIFSSPAASPCQFPSLLLASISPLSLNHSLLLSLSHSGSWACIYRRRGSNWTAVHSPIRELGSWGLNLSQRKATVQYFLSLCFPSALLCPVLCHSSLFNYIYLTSLLCFYISFKNKEIFVHPLSFSCVWSGGVMLVATATITLLSCGTLGLYELWPLALGLSVYRLALFWVHALSFSECPPVV